MSPRRRGGAPDAVTRSWRTSAASIVVGTRSAASAARSAARAACIALQVACSPCGRHGGDGRTGGICGLRRSGPPAPRGPRARPAPGPWVRSRGAAGVSALSGHVPGCTARGDGPVAEGVLPLKWCRRPAENGNERHGCSRLARPPRSPRHGDRRARRRGADTGWGPLIERLVADGLPRERVEQVFADPRMPAFTGIEFSGRTPKEPLSRYRGFLRPAGVAAGRRRLAAHARAFEAAAARGVPASLLAAIMTIESACGRSTGTNRVLYRLARLAMANEPGNVAENLARLAGTVEPARVAARARYLEATFYPEVRAAFAMADRLGVDPLELRGSEAGAFGYPQFLPRNYLEAGVDGDGDGRVSLF